MSGTRDLFDDVHLLESLDGDAELMAELVQLFVDDAPRQVEALRGAAAASDMRAAEHAVHTLKGAAANLNAGRVRERATAFEAELKVGTLSSAVALLPELEDAVKATVRVMAGARS